MSRQTEGDPLRIEYAVRVWAQLRALSDSEVEMLKRVLDQLALQLSKDAASGDLASSPRELRTLELGEIRVTYEANRSRRVLAVLEVERSPSGIR